MSSSLIFARDGRDLPYFPMTVAAVEAIEERVPERRPYAFATYVVLLSIANQHRSDRAPTSQTELVRRTGASRRTVQRSLEDLQGAGVLVVIECVHARLRTENEYVLVEPGQQLAESAAPQGRNAAPQGRNGGASSKQLKKPVVAGQRRNDDDESRCAPEAQPLTPEEKKPSGNAREKEQNQVPGDFPDELRPHARIVMRALLDAAVARNANEVTAEAVGLAVMDFPRKPLVDVAKELRNWLIVGEGQTKQCKDVVRRYRDWLRKEPNLATIEILDDDGNPVAPGQPRAGANVTPILRSRHRGPLPVNARPPGGYPDPNAGKRGKHAQ